MNRKNVFLTGAVLIAMLLLTGGMLTASAAPGAVTALPMIADFEGGFPAGWFQYDAGGVNVVNASVINVLAGDPLALPGQVGANDILSVTANVPDWAGFGAGFTPVQNWSDYEAVSFWYYGGNLGTVHEFEIQTANAGNRRATFVDDFTGWRQIILPFHTFGTGGAYDVSQVTNWVFVLDGTVGFFHFDNLQLVNIQPFADFEGGVPAGWFQYDAGGANVVNASVTNVLAGDPLALPGQIGANDILSVTANVPDWAGFGAGFTPVQNWSDMQGVSFWFYGENSGTTHEFEIQTANAGDRRATFVDNFTGWRMVVLPFTTFGNTPYDVSQVDNWVFVLDGTVGSFALDHLSVYGDAGNIPVRVQFEPAAYTVTEGETATVTVKLNVASLNPVTVDYATVDDTAQAGTDYAAAAGTLTFNAGEMTQSFTVDTIDNNVLDGDKSVNLVLSNPVSATLGSANTATLLIRDNEQPNYSNLQTVIVDDFENGLPQGVDGDNNAIGFVTWGDFWTGTTVAITTTLVADSDLLALPGQSGDNNLMHFQAMVNGWGGFTHAFENDAVDTWVPQDWSKYTGMSFWLYGQNTGNDLLFEINENRNPGSTVADTEIWSYAFKDDFAGWKQFTVGFDEFIRKEIGNGAPNDGFTREEVHGWAFGTLNTGGQTVTYYLDDVALIIHTSLIDDFESGLPQGVDGNNNGIGFVTWGDFWTGTTVAITTTSVADSDPLALPGQSGDNNLMHFQAMVNGWGGFTHAFENESVDTWVPQNWSSYEGIRFWLFGQNTGNDLLFEINENRNPGSTVADTEIWSHAFKDDFTGWRLFILDFGNDFTRKEIGNGAPNDGFTREEVHGWAFGTLNTGGQTVTYYLDDVMVYGNTGSDQPVTVAFALGKVSVDEGQLASLTVKLNREHDQPVTVQYTTAEATARVGQQYTPVSGTLTIPAGTLTQTVSIPTLHDSKHTRDTRVAVNLYEGAGAPLGFQRRSVLTIVDIDPADPRLVDDFQGAHPFIYQDGTVDLSITTVMTGDVTAIPGQGAYEDVLTVAHDGASSFSRIFSQGQDWSGFQGLSFWFYGQNSGETITYQLRDNMAATTAEVDPADWVLVWSDEFNGPTGTPPNRNIWKHELGDGALNEIVGWGNSEFQFYTDNTENSFMDGNGNLVIRLQETPIDTDLVCWYGPCEYTSARLITQDQLDFEYGRIEARVQVPGGPGGLWPAFWMLGADIPEVGWPQTGEIDIMEYVSRLPYEVFGTIHGPGYSGGASFGSTHTFTQTVPSKSYLTYGVEWTPNLIIWYVDDIRYHQAIPANVSPNEWVFNHPFFLLLNAAIGGNFGGAIADGMTFPQDTLVDYVRVYQAADSAERFEFSFVDAFTGWRQITLPFGSFTRSAMQPAGAPNDGLTLNQVWGYGVQLPPASSGTFAMDQVRLVEQPAILTIVKDAIPDSSFNFRFTASPASAALPAEFMLDNPTVDDNDGVPNRRSFMVGNGVFTISELVPAGWHLADIVCTNGATVTKNLTTATATITLNNADVTCTFVDAQDVTIQTTVYYDRNGNGQRDSREQSLNLWQVTATELPAMTRSYRQVTNAIGKANFNFLPAGAYKVCVVLVSGWTNSQPSGSPCHTVNLAPGQLAMLSFGVRPGSAVAAEVTAKPIGAVTVMDGYTPVPDDNTYLDLTTWVDPNLAMPLTEDGAQQGEEIDLAPRVFLPVITR
jgi:beta-glucanase (GH16 family)